jgi:hypothetical protein
VTSQAVPPKAQEILSASDLPWKDALTFTRRGGEGDEGEGGEAGEGGVMIGD